MDDFNQTPAQQFWIAKKIGIPVAGLTREHISQYQLDHLRQTISWATSRSPFYRQHLSKFYGYRLESLEELQALPLMTPEMLREQGAGLLCVSQNQINRVVTLESSGTTGKAKRIFFTRTEQQHIEDYFEHGLRTFVDQTDHVLILLPGSRPGSVVDLLQAALDRLGILSFTQGHVGDILTTVKMLAKQRITSLIGIPVQVLALARVCRAAGVEMRMKSVLLTGDYIPEAIIRELKTVWECEVFEHYGMTEMGLGGAMQCETHQGYHLREGDLYFEIINVSTGQPVPAGEEGEIVFTTFTRQGMPLIRYRTGDISRFLPEPCPCGTPLRKIARVKRRTAGFVQLNEHNGFAIADLDEALFSIETILDFTVIAEKMRDRTKLTIELHTLDHSNQSILLAHQALQNDNTLGKYICDGCLNVTIRSTYCGMMLEPRAAKRRIELREA